MNNFLILNNYKLKFFFILFFIISTIFFFNLFLIERINLNIFCYLSILFFLNYFLLHFYYSIKKEENFIPIYPLIIFYYLLTYSSYFYFHQEVRCIIPPYSFYINSSEIFPNVILIISLGIFFFSLGYFFPNRFYKKKELYIFKEVDKYQYLILLFFIIIIIYIYLNNQYKLINLGFLSQLKQPLILFVIAFLQLKYLETKKKIILLIYLILTGILFCAIVPSSGLLI